MSTPTTEWRKAMVARHEDSFEIRVIEWHEVRKGEPFKIVEPSGHVGPTTFICVREANIDEEIQPMLVRIAPTEAEISRQPDSALHLYGD